MVSVHLKPSAGLRPLFPFQTELFVPRYKLLFATDCPAFNNTSHDSSRTLTKRQFAFKGPACGITLTLSWPSWYDCTSPLDTRLSEYCYTSSVSWLSLNHTYSVALWNRSPSLFGRMIASFFNMILHYMNSLLPASLSSRYLRIHLTRPINSTIYTT